MRTIPIDRETGKCPNPDLLRVLVACEFSGVVRDAFAKCGHDAWSVDLRPSESAGRHFLGDALAAIREQGPWDLLIAHPPCTHLSVSGARWFPAKRADGRQQAAIEFFMALARADIPAIAIENPVCIMSSLWRKPDQIVQPWQFGEDASKATCLWLKNLPALTPTHYVAGRLVNRKLRWANQTDSGQNRLGPSPTRERERSRTYPGIAAAMAAQWSNLNATA